MFDPLMTVKVHELSDLHSERLIAKALKASQQAVTAASNTEGRELLAKAQVLSEKLVAGQ